jgi:hypothetical protein
MNNVFSEFGLTIYGDNPWKVVNSRKFNENEIAAIRSNTVVDSKFGKSVCFYLKGGGQTYIPLSTRGNDATLGSSIDMAEAKLVTLHRDGDGDIVRVEL